MKKFLFAGMGGQGILSMGRFWTESGLIEGKEVSYLPAYGPEMRGGTANCAVIISRTPIASPLCNKPDVLIAMNAPQPAPFCQKRSPERADPHQRQPFRRFFGARRRAFSRADGKRSGARGGRRAFRQHGNDGRALRADRRGFRAQYSRLPARKICRKAEPDRHQ